MTDRAVIAIGVKHAGDLVELPGAVNGAKEFARWAEAQGYSTTLITDEATPVTVARLKTAIKDVVKGSAERLLIYFAGHGIQPSVNTAYWLLSNWQDDSDEAVNVSLSLANAKRTALEQISVFSDACRSTVKDAALVGGSSIFPKPSSSPAKLPQWDHFFASRLGEVSQEVPGTDPTQAYGIFTRCVMQALNGNADKAVEQRENRLRVVTSGKLAGFLEDAVPLESGKTKGAAVQFPEVISGWRSPKDIYVAIETVPPPGSLESLRGPSGTGPSPRPSRTAKKPASPRAKKAVASARAQGEAALVKIEAALEQSEGRRSFETGQGLTIVGSKALQIKVGRSGADLFAENEAYHVRGKGGRAQSILIELNEKNWVATVIFPKFVGTIVVSDGCAVSMNYVPISTRGQSAPRFPKVDQLVHRWNALMNLGHTPDCTELKQSAEQLRQYKHQNPSLGILAAYAYERAGIIDQIDDMADWFGEAGQPVPFDVAMLSTRRIKKEAGRWMIQTRTRRAPIAGMFPLMTQGWAFLEKGNPLVSKALLDARSGLVPSLWTTLRDDAALRLGKVIARGDN